MFKFSKKPAGPIDFIIVGLGNPGMKYDNTRHNVGFRAVDALAADAGCGIDRNKFKGLCGVAQLGDARCLLLKPQTYMNNSGESVAEAAGFYKIPADRIVIIFDDISLPVGKLRIRRNGSDGGHNGIKSVIMHTGSKDFPRVKIGVGAKPHPDYDLASWVLSGFKPDENEPLSHAVGNAVEAVKLIVSGSIDKAMNSYN